jgi:hypothetical protein
MTAVGILTLIFMIVSGIPNQKIDDRHRKRDEPGHAWGYHAKLGKEGNWEGRFMMWSSYIGIYFIFGPAGYTFYFLRQ